MADVLALSSQIPDDPLVLQKWMNTLYEDRRQHGDWERVTGVRFFEYSFFRRTNYLPGSKIPIYEYWATRRGHSRDKFLLGIHLSPPSTYLLGNRLFDLICFMHEFELLLP
jgi:hypothetical protein